MTFGDLAWGGGGVDTCDRRLAESTADERGERAHPPGAAAATEAAAAAGRLTIRAGRLATPTVGGREGPHGVSERDMHGVQRNKQRLRCGKRGRCICRQYALKRA